MTDHDPVLLDEVLAAVCTDRAGRYVDATFGRGGHSRALLDRLAPAGRLLVIDRDPEAVAEADRLAATDARVTACRARFGRIRAVAEGAGFDRVAGVMMDLGVSSPQLDAPARGFSFRTDGPLDMRMDPDQPLTAAGWLNSAPESELARVFRELGEERWARRIARAVVEARSRAPLATTAQFAELIERAQPRPDPHKHAATRVFQAVRIHVNEELDELEQALAGAFDLLQPHGRLAVLSFHSLEDRIVKRAFTNRVRGPAAPRRMPVPGIVAGVAHWVVKHARPTAAEVARNPRARSATLRVVERIA